jgi:peptide/nickel transport system permease protein
MRGSARFLFRRVLQGALVLVLIACLNFFLLHLAPGDIAEVLAGQSGGGDEEYLATLRRSFGLDAPLVIQLFDYLRHLAKLDFGFSHYYQQPVIHVILERLGPTVLLLSTSLVLALAGGIALGMAAARRPGTWVDSLVSVISLVGYAVPLFWLGLMLIVVFSLKLGVFPSSGMYTIGRHTGTFGQVKDVAMHLVLPAFTLAVFFMATYARIARTQMLQVYGLEFIRTARAKGLSETRVAYRHVLRNALLPLLSLLGVQVGSILGGSVVVEVVFSWPGLGRLAFDALTQRDLNMLMGQLFFCSVVVVATNLLVDLLYSVVDPRIEMAA